MGEPERIAAGGVGFSSMLCTGKASAP